MPESQNTTGGSPPPNNRGGDDLAAQRTTDALLERIDAKADLEAAEAVGEPAADEPAADDAQPATRANFDAAVAVASEKTFAEQMQDLQLEDYRQDIKFRKEFAQKLFVLIALWLMADIVILLLHGWTDYYIDFKLSDGVLIALISGTTASVLGLFTAVVLYMFPGRNK